MEKNICTVQTPILNIGAVIKRMREGAGFTTETFGKMMNWSKSTVSKVENGIRGISADELYKIAMILGKPITAFYPDIVTEECTDDIPNISSYAEEIRDMANLLNESGGELTNDIEEKAKEVFLRLIPQKLYRILNVTPDEVSIKGTLMRGAHFIPRIEVHFIGRRGYELDWFYIVLSFRDNLKHIFLSLVQNTSIRFRADYEPIDQTEQLDELKDYCTKIITEKQKEEHPEDDTVSVDIFEDEEGLPTETGAIWSYGYVPVNPPEAYDVTEKDTVYPDMDLFVTSNFDGRVSITGDTIPALIINTMHQYNEPYGYDNEYKLMCDIDKDIMRMFASLSFLIEQVEKESFIRWKKEALTKMDIGKSNQSEYTLSFSYTALQGQPIIRSDMHSKKMKIFEEHDYKCEISPNHESFINKQNGKPYMEISYLIPLHAQKDFKKDLNCDANFVCLCPVCNRKLVYGTENTVEDMIVPLYYSRKDALKAVGINISLKQLLDYYGC